MVHVHVKLFWFQIFIFRMVGGWWMWLCKRIGIKNFEKCFLLISLLFNLLFILILAFFHFFRDAFFFYFIHLPNKQKCMWYPYMLRKKVKKMMFLSTSLPSSQLSSLCMLARTWISINSDENVHVYIFVVHWLTAYLLLIFIPIQFFNTLMLYKSKFFCSF